jgi:hypothetical protein
MVENLFCTKMVCWKNQQRKKVRKSPEKRASGERRTRDATSHAVTSLRLFASRAMAAAAKTISIDVVSDIV